VKNKVIFAAVGSIFTFFVAEIIVSLFVNDLMVCTE